MIYKSRTESTELQILRSLNYRMELSPNDKQHYFNLKKGYEGEVMFDTLTEKLHCDCLILNDLLFKVNRTIFQLDTVIINPEQIYLFEVKNFEGDYYYENERFYKNPKLEITNPFSQLSRAESLFRQLLHSIGYKIPIEALIVFINPEFSLYQVPQNKPFIHPTQVNRYLRKLNSIPSRLNSKHLTLADKLISMHIPDSPYKQIPTYSFELLLKGITCKKCTSLSTIMEKKTCICQECGHEERNSSAIMRSVREYQLLFPNRKVTTNSIFDWCSVVDSKRKIRTTLKENLQIVGVHQWSYYK
ncbi:nuclease-related domain-containing protein [Niallia sp. XMNu-256]|uniref:nuclease-related domain-containing protein n=1 Tax=Niallia sp. XMNu-256 TaxID=3082444 RepID=UPI0030CD4D96